MGDSTRISWADKTLNFWMGCRHVSAECDRCYAEAMINRLRDTPEQKAPGFKGLHTFDTIVRTKTWPDAMRWQREAARERKYYLVFTCSLSDFFIQDADAWRPEAWQIIKSTPNLVYQILTKRPALIAKRLPPDWGKKGYPNVLLGVSVGLKKTLNRMDQLNEIPCYARFVSAEPLLENIMPELESHAKGFQQIIVGGESGNRSEDFRPMDHAWAREILRMCRRHKIAFFFKQSAARETEMGTQLDGVTYKEQCRHYYEYTGQKSTLF